MVNASKLARKCSVFKVIDFKYLCDSFFIFYIILNC
nr:MAG TPA: hypothetical protein [Caudoviricetes sp.]